MSLHTAVYQFSLSTTAPPTGSEVRLDAAYPYDMVTTAWIRNAGTDGVDIKVILLAIPIGATLYLQDKDDSSKYAHFETTGAPVDQTTYVAVPVMPVAHGAALLAQQVLVALVTDSTLPPSGESPGGGPARLVTLAQAKGHLLLPIIADDPGDPDLQLKLNAAEATILDYIGSTAHWRDVVAAWTATTDPVEPPWYVIAAILLQLGELWRYRGDDGTDQAPPRDANDDLAPAIVALLRRTRDPVLA